jgi:hypothetical protein
MPRRIESLFVAGPAGRLETLLEEPEDIAPREAALVCHPHPQHGGTMHNKVVYRMARGLRRSGAVVARFNYRGVNLSEGVYDRGEGELEDARAVLSLLRSRYPALPFTLAGFSFGSRIALRLACGAPPEQDAQRPRRVIAVGFPVAYKDSAGLTEDCGVPRTFIQSTHDQFGAVEDLVKVVESVPEPKSLELIEARDHFFDGGLQELEDAIAILK